MIPFRDVLLPFDPPTTPRPIVDPVPVVGVKREKARHASKRDKLLAVLKSRLTITNVEAREIAGLRAMGRVNELQKMGEPIEVRHRKGGLWEIRYR